MNFRGRIIKSQYRYQKSFSILLPINCAGVYRKGTSVTALIGSVIAAVDLTTISLRYCSFLFYSHQSWMHLSRKFST